MHMTTVAVLSVARSNVEVARHLVHLQDAPNHAALRSRAHTPIQLLFAALRRIVVDEPRVPSTLDVGSTEIRTRITTLR